MNTKFHCDDRLIEPVLRHAARLRESTPRGEHPDEETMALFAMGALDATHRPAIVEHLSLCAACRKASSMALKTSVPTVGFVRPRIIVILLQRPRLWATAAAALFLLVLSVFFIERSGQDLVLAERQTYEQATDLLLTGEFERSRELVSVAARRGIESDRLRNIEAQSLRRMPGPTALALAGRLTDFGYEIGGFAARSPQKPDPNAEQALNILSEFDAADANVRLNRGHALLALDRPRDALVQFQQATQRTRDSPLAWLGLGLAHFMLDDFSAAERAFRACLRLDRNQLGAKMNLAMTLEELAEWRPALTLWQEVLTQPVSESDRRQIEAAIAELKRQLGE